MARAHQESSPRRQGQWFANSPMPQRQAGNHRDRDSCRKAVSVWHALRPPL